MEKRTGAQFDAPAAVFPMRLRVHGLKWLARYDLVSLFGVLFAMALGSYARLIPFWGTDMPLNDGGLFYQMTLDLQQNGFTFPAYATYNGHFIPFAYPPLGFVLAGLVSKLAHIPLLQTYQFLPLLFSILCIPLVFLLARELLGSRVQAVYAACAFAVSPRSYEWLIMGGGMTRALGLILVLAALYQGLEWLKYKKPTYIATTGILAGLAFLSHPEMYLLLPTSLLLIFLFYDRSVRGFLGLAVSGGIAVLIASVWWLFVFSRHGAGPLQAALQSGQHGLDNLVFLLFFNSTAEPFGTLIAILALIGIFVAFAQKRWFLPIWFFLLYMVVPRSAPTYVMVPVSMLAALCLDQVIIPGIQRIQAILPAPHRVGSEATPAAGWVITSMFSIFMILSIMNAWGTGLLPGTVLKPVSKQERTAMEWIRDNTPANASFLVITAGDQWSSDRSAEWFPVLAERSSINTVQGYEWVPGLSFGERTAQYEHLQECRQSDSQCLERWAADYDKNFSYVYVAKTRRGLLQDDCCAILREALAKSPNYALIYDGPGAVVFRRR